MNTNFMTKLIQALRSGDYKKGRIELSYLDGNGDRVYCAMGVACDVAVKNRFVTYRWIKKTDRNYRYYEFGNHSAKPPRIIQRLIEDEDLTKPGDFIRTVMDMNDFGDLEFDNLADVLEKYMNNVIELNQTKSKSELVPA